MLVKKLQFFARAHFTNDRVSEWVIKFKGLSKDSGQRGPYSPYKPCNHSLYIGIIIFSHIDWHTIYQATINFKKKDIKNETQQSEGNH